MAYTIDLHALQTLPPSCVNRDDSGSPKTATFGGVLRARVSSQSWKKRMREYFNEHLDTSKTGLRTYYAVEKIADEMVKLQPELEREEAVKLAGKALITAKFAQGKADKKTGEISFKTDALAFFSHKQLQKLAEDLVADPAVAADKKKVQGILKADQSIDLALFGRMVASDPEMNVDASCQVAHAIGINATETEFDYFTAMDDFAEQDHAGAGHLGVNEFTSNTFYRFSSISGRALEGALGNAHAAAEAVTAYAEAFFQTVPAGRQSTYAAMPLPHCLIVTVREGRAIDYSSAFVEPVAATAEASLLEVAAGRMASYAADVEANLLQPVVKTWVVTVGSDMDALHALGEKVTLRELLDELPKLLEGSEEVAEDASEEAPTSAGVPAEAPEVLDELTVGETVAHPHRLLEETAVPTVAAEGGHTPTISNEMPSETAVASEAPMVEEA